MWWKLFLKVFPSKNLIFHTLFFSTDEKYVKNNHIFNFTEKFFVLNCATILQCDQFCKIILSKILNQDAVHFILPYSNLYRWIFGLRFIMKNKQENE